MAIIYVPRSDTLEEFRQKFNQLSELIGDSSGVIGDSPLSSIAEYIASILFDVDVLQTDVDQLQLDLGDVSSISADSPQLSASEYITNLLSDVDVLQTDVDQLQLDLGDVSLLSSDSPVASVVEAINLLVLPFYDSTGAVKNIPLKIA